MKIINKTLFLFLLICINGAYSDDLPFGSYGLNRPEGATFSEKIQSCHDSLGFNYFWDHFTYSQIQEMADSGVTAIHQGDSTEAIFKFSNYNYAKIEAEQCNSGIRMYDCGGYFDSDGSDSVWVADGDSIEILYGPNGFGPPCWSFCDETPKLYIKMERAYREGAAADDYDQPIEYFVRVRIKMGGDSVGADVPVCSLKATFQPWDAIMIDTMRIDVITTGDIDTVNSWVEFTSPGFSIPESVYVDSAGTQIWVDSISSIGVAVIIEALGVREVKIDWIKIYDDKGFKLVEGDDYSSEIEDYADSMANLYSDLWGFYMRDEPYYTGIPVMGALMDTARAYGRSECEGITAIHWDYNYQWWFDNNPNSNVFTPDIYPFTSGGYQNEPYYTGFCDTCNTLNQHRNSRYLQNRFQYFEGKCKLAFEAADGSDADYWIIPQCFTGGSADSTGIFWRKPTPSELRCQTFMALASGARGVIYWKYGVSYFPSTGAFIEGIYGLDNNKTDLWGAIFNDINPYIKAIDDIYMTLTFRQSYYYSPDIGIDTTASNAFIDTIYAVSDTPNLDLGWFQIGEYTEGSDKYVMIVNRACSSNDDGDPAPSITATIKFDTQDLDLGNYVEIIDIADSVDYISYDSVLVFADTTLASSLGGLITHSTILGPGEGRLFKLVSMR